jgi:hypothetical protein
MEIDDAFIIKEPLMDGGAALPPSLKPWMPQSEEVAWLIYLQEFPMIFVLSALSFIGMHVFMQLILRATSAGGTVGNKQIRLPNRREHFSSPDIQTVRIRQCLLCSIPM